MTAAVEFIEMVIVAWEHVLQETDARHAEGAALEFRAEFFNIFNHANFNVPVNTTGPNGSGGNGDQVFLGRASACNPAVSADGCGILVRNVGRIFSTVTTSRQIQFAVKLMF